MSSENLAICLEAVRRAYVYVDGLEEWLEHPRRTGSERGRISVEGLKGAFKAIAKHCPIPDYLRERFEEWSRKAEESPWQTVAEFGWSPSYIKNSLSDVLRALSKSFGFKEEMYESYIPE